MARAMHALVKWGWQSTSSPCDSFPTDLKISTIFTRVFWGSVSEREVILFPCGFQAHSVPAQRTLCSLAPHPPTQGRPCGSLLHLRPGDRVCARHIARCFNIPAFMGPSLQLLRWFFYLFQLLRCGNVDTTRRITCQRSYN